MKEAVSIPVIGNGDVASPLAAVRMMQETGCDFVMIARGAQGNPFIFRQICELMKYGEVRYNPSAAEKVRQALAAAAIEATPILP